MTMPHGAIVEDRRCSLTVDIATRAEYDQLIPGGRIVL